MRKGISHLTVNITNSCNLDCSYCFVDKNATSMGIETGKETIDFLMEHSGEEKDLHISFFGGEPLLKFDLMKEMVAYGKLEAKKRQKKITFGVTTNATLITQEVADFLWDYGVGILFSWDGTRERIESVKGKAGYDRMLRSLRMLQAKGYNVTGRVTVDPDYLNIVGSAIHMREVGFSKMIFSVMSDTDRGEYGRTVKAFDDYATYFIRMAKEGHLVPDQMLIKNIMLALGLETVSEVPCDLAVKSFGVTCDGAILPCHHQECWRDDFELGNVRDKEIDDTRREPFLKFRREDVVGCQGCFARSRCNSSCPKMNYGANKDIMIPWSGYCDFVKARYLAVDRIIEELYGKKKDLFFIREIVKRRLDWSLNEIETPISVDDMLNQGDSLRPRIISFSIRDDQLSLKTGDIIARFLEKNENRILAIMKPIPRCVFGKDYDRLQERHRFPRDKAYSFLRNEDRSVVQGEIDSMRSLFGYLTRNMDLNAKCRSCMYRLRGDCDYCYLGF